MKTIRKMMKKYWNDFKTDVKERLFQLKKEIKTTKQQKI
jgi:hypothetical protein